MKGRAGQAPADLIEFCTAEHDGLVRFLGLYCGQPALAEELAHEALIRACRDWSKVRSMPSPRAWLRRVAVNSTNSYFRRRAAERRARDRLESEPSPATINDPADALVVRQALASLSSRQRMVLLMRYFDDLSVSDIANSLECSENTVKSLLRRGLAALRETETMKELREALNV
jgi:RNA polymerase sigma factor (sigma-70 family)